MKHLFFYILFFISGIIFSQQDSVEVNYDLSTPVQIRAFDKNNIEVYKGDSDFDYTQAVQEEGIVAKLWRWIKRKMLLLFEWLFGVGKAVGYLANFLRVIPYIVAGIVILLLIKFFLKLNVKSIADGKSEKAQVILTEDEVLIQDGNIQEFIEKAIHQKNYRLAVRYYYLLVLQQLQNKDLIVWEQQKTNDDYIKELQKHIFHQSFGEITRLYDFVWYGNFEINAIEFSNVEAQFIKATAKLN